MIEFSQYGWHGVISEEITFENVAIVAQAAADLLNEVKNGAARVVVGFDTRFLSREYAWAVQRVLTGNGIFVHLHKKPVPSSLLALSVKLTGSDLGIMVTGEGRPARYSGLTFKGPQGMPVTEEWMSGLFNYLYRRYPRTSDDSRAFLSYVDIFDEYGSLLDSFIDFKIIKDTNPLIISDSFFGSVGSYFYDILKRSGLNCLSIRSKPNPGFMESVPQPNERNLQPLAKLVRQRGAAMGVFFNGDGSQAGIVDAEGSCLPFSFVSPAVMAEWLKAAKGSPSCIYTGLSTPESARILAKHLKLEEKPLSELRGSQNGPGLSPEGLSAADWLDKSVFWDRHAISFGALIPDRDSIIQVLLLLQGLCRRNGDWKRLKEDVAAIAGKRRAEQKSINISRQAWQRKLEELTGGAAHPFRNTEILKMEEDKELKLYMADGTWIAFDYNWKEENVVFVYDAPCGREDREFICAVVQWLADMQT